MTSKHELAIVILTEDSGEQGRPTVEALVRHMLRLAVPGVQSHRIEFVPRDPREEEAMRGNVWRADGRNPVERERCVRLLRYIVRRLSQPDTFVVFHIDGDRTWSERHMSENVAKFERLVLARLPQVADRGRAHRLQGKPVRDATQATPLQLDHLLLICPFRSIEAWLYQNVKVAIEICEREHRRAHVDDLNAWESRRAELDELAHPEKTVCLGKQFNLELASRAFPAQETDLVKKSFTESMDRLRTCGALTRALERTRTLS